MHEIIKETRQYILQEYYIAKTEDHTINFQVASK